MPLGINEGEIGILKAGVDGQGRCNFGPPDLKLVRVLASSFKFAAEQGVRLLWFCFCGEGV